MSNAVITGDTAIVSYPVDVWFSGGKTFDAQLDFGPRKIAKIVLDPHCRFPDRDPSDNVWPRGAPLSQPATAGRGGRAPVCSN